MVNLIKEKSLFVLFGNQPRFINSSERWLKKNGKRIFCIIDNDYKLDGTSFMGYPVCPVQRLEVMDKKELAVIVDANKLKQYQLRSMGFIQNQDFFELQDLIFPTDVSEHYFRDVYAPWLCDKEFIKVYSRARRQTMVDITRCYELATLVQQAKNLPGNILEVGVWQGGTAFLLAHYAEKMFKKVYLADTFCGIPIVNPDRDLSYREKEHADTSAKLVQELLKTENLGYELLVGIFPEDTGKEIEDEMICFCHIDVDVYQSAKEVTEWVWPRMPSGGIIVYDDYGFSGCNGVTDYVNEACRQSDRTFVYNLNGHGIFIKR